MARSAKPLKRKPASQRSKLPRYVVKLHEDDFFDEEDAEVLRLIEPPRESWRLGCVPYYVSVDKRVECSPVHTIAM
uniref:hypothetical protein n=1 Tax=Shigella flexneri TaxID=623 RepID=UPI00223C5FA1|nr:hypothetical protein [Shigella flexneri]